MARKTKKNDKVGRPTIMTPETIAKLEEAFSWEWSDLKACDYAGINPSVLYNYQKKHPQFVKRKEMLKASPAEIAKRNVINAMADGDLKTSQWYLERRQSEYSLKKQVDVNVEHKLDERHIAERLAYLVEKTRQIQADPHTPQLDHTQSPQEPDDTVIDLDIE